jgi:Rieske Fe-S protein
MELRRSPIALVLVAAVAVVATAVGVTLLVRHTAPDGFVHAASLEELAERRVIYVAPARAFLVHQPEAPLALSARSPHLGARVRYCASSEWFQDRYGAMFDARGRYVLGPANRGLDRFHIEIREDEIYIDTTQIILGPPRGDRDLEAAGPFCGPD